jgi:hypothetical protein
VALGSEEAKKLVLLMVETELVSIMDEGLGDEIDLLVSGLDYPVVVDRLAEVGVTHQVIYFSGYWIVLNEWVTV